MSLQEGGRYRTSHLNAGQVADRHTMVAVELDGEPLHLDHGFPARLMAPGRPGVEQTSGSPAVEVVATKRQQDVAALGHPSAGGGGVGGAPAVAHRHRCPSRTPMTPTPPSSPAGSWAAPSWSTSVVPAALAVGRVLRGSAWSQRLRWPLAASATLALVAWPFVRGYGRSAGNPSLLPRDHGTGVAAAIASVWLLSVVVAVLAFVGRRRRPPG